MALPMGTAFVNTSNMRRRALLVDENSNVHTTAFVKAHMLEPEETQIRDATARRRRRFFWIPVLRMTQFLLGNPLEPCSKSQNFAPAARILEYYNFIYNFHQYYNIREDPPPPRTFLQHLSYLGPGITISDPL